MAGRLVSENSPGGSAILSALGVRIFLPPSAAHLSPVALRINVGEDFPVEVEKLFRRWNIVIDFQRHESTPTTRADVAYHDASLDSRDFKYTTPVIPSRPLDVQGSPILGARVFHLFTNPQDLHEEVLSLEKLRYATGLGMPLIIREPRSKSYIPENLQHAYDAAKLADLISPNHVGLLEFFAEPTSAAFDRHRIEKLAQRLVDSGIGPDANGTIVSPRSARLPPQHQADDTFIAASEPCPCIQQSRTMLFLYFKLFKVCLNFCRPDQISLPHSLVRP